MMTFLVYLLIFLVLGTAVYGAWSAAPWLPTRNNDVKRMIKLANIKPGERVYDLGCGDGRLVFGAEAQGAEAIGIEVFILPYLYAAIKNLFHKRTKILFGDLFNYDLSGADVVFIFLMSKSYQKLAKKFEEELKPGTRVVTSCWPIDDWKDKLVKEDKPTDKDLPIYLYQI
jgi:SAM-dependent methyltransferase